jgi:hypothetical protein
VRRRAWAAAGLAAVAVTVPAVELGYAAAVDGGPRVVRPGKRVTFRLSGMHPDSVMTVRLQRVPCRDKKYGCGGRAIYGGRSSDGRYRSDADGRAKISFRWPRRYVRCEPVPSVPGNCRRYRWRPGERVRLSVCDYSQIGPCVARRVRTRR